MAITSSTVTYGVRSTHSATSSGVTGNVIVGQPENQISLASADVAWTGQLLLVDSAAGGAVATTINLRTGTSSASTWTAGTAQVETTTIDAVSGCTTNGTMTMVVTSTGMAGSPLNVAAALTTALNTASLVAAAARAALAANTTIAARFTVSGTGADIVLTRRGVPFTAPWGDVEIHDGVNDGDLSIFIPTGLGITTDDSVNTTAAVATNGVLHRDVDGKDWEGTTLTSIATGKIGALQVASALNSTGGVTLDHAAASVGFDLMPLPPGGVVLVAAPNLNSTISEGLIISSVTGGTIAVVTISVVGSTVS